MIDHGWKLMMVYPLTVWAVLAVCQNEVASQPGLNVAQAVDEGARNRNVVAEQMLVDPVLGAKVLEVALENGPPAVVVETIQILERSQNPTLLRDVNGRPSPLVRAMHYPDQRVQFFAANAVLKIGPNEKFPHTVRVVTTLARAIDLETAPLVIIVDGNITRANETGALLNQLGYAYRVVRSGRDAFKGAAESSAIDFIVTEPVIHNTELRQTITELRADARTSGTPIFVFSDSVWVSRPSDQARLSSRLDRLEKRFTGVYAIRRPINVDDWRGAFERSFPARNKAPLTPAEKATYQRLSLEWLLRIAKGEALPGARQLSPEAVDALQRMLQDLDLGPLAAEVLGHVPSAKNQQALTEILLSASTPGPTRLAACDALAQNVRQGGWAIERDATRELLKLQRTTVDSELHTSLSRLVGIFVVTGRP
ncbi:MAG: hypothetical protein WD648_07820 [Planctomycetaceae bacterium]